MASNRLLVPPSTPIGGTLVGAVTHLIAAQQSVARVNGVLSQSVRAAGGSLVDSDFEPLALELYQGNTTPTPEMIDVAKQLFYLTALVLAKVNDPLLVEFAQRCDQG